MAIIGYKDLGNGTNAQYVTLSDEELETLADKIAEGISNTTIVVDEIKLESPTDGTYIGDIKFGEDLPLPTGAATAAKQPALGTVGSPSADVITVQGVSGGTTLPVTATAGNTLATVSATIANGASLSGVVDIGEGRVLCAIDMPADWTAANLTFQASTASDGTYDNLYDQYGTEKTVTAAEDRYIPLDDPAFWLGVRYVKVRSGTAASAVNQGAERVITLVTKPV